MSNETIQFSTSLVLDKLEQYILRPSGAESDSAERVEKHYMRKWKWYVYILECLDGTYYTGLTWRPEIRYDQHLSKFGSKYTAKHGIKKLAYLEEHEDLETARRREIQIKGWSQEKKEKLIKGEWKKDW